MCSEEAAKERNSGLQAVVVELLVLADQVLSVERVEAECRRLLGSSRRSDFRAGLFQARDLIKSSLRITSILGDSMTICISKDETKRPSCNNVCLFKMRQIKTGRNGGLVYQ